MSTPGSATDKPLTSERRTAFQDALETLYIKGNMGGRLKFAADWPDAALYVFGPELTLIDREGSKDKALKSRLEEEAENRRLALADLCARYEEASAHAGILNADYVGQTIAMLGRNLALCLYAPWIVDKFIPPADTPAEPQIETPQAAPVPQLPEPPRVLPQIMLPVADIELIRPISVEPEIAPTPEAPPPENALPDPLPLPPDPVENIGEPEIIAPVPAIKKGLRVFGITEKPDLNKASEDTPAKE